MPINFTTGQVAKICKVAPRTVTKWFDSGQLKGFLIPSSKDRRIPQERLLEFLVANNIPIGPALDMTQRRVLLIGMDHNATTILQRLLPSNNDFKLLIADDSFHAGLQIDDHPIVMVLDYNLGRSCVKAIFDHAKNMVTKPKLIALISDDMDPAQITGFDMVHHQSVDISQLALDLHRIAFEYCVL